MQKEYHELIASGIYFSGASGIQQIADMKHINVVDLRKESTDYAMLNPALIWQKILPGMVRPAHRGLLIPSRSKATVKSSSVRSPTYSSKSPTKPGLS